MAQTDTQRTIDEIADLAAEVFANQIRPALRPEDDGKFVALDVDTGDYEINEDDYTAVTRLKLRSPNCESWLMRVGSDATYEIGLMP